MWCLSLYLRTHDRLYEGKFTSTSPMVWDRKHDGLGLKEIHIINYTSLVPSRLRELSRPSDYTKSVNEVLRIISACETDK